MKSLINRIIGTTINQIELIFKDDGPGIPQPILEGFKLHQTVTTKMGGYGLGVGNCFTILDGMKGTFQIDNINKELGQGIVIKMTIPISQVLAFPNSVGKNKAQIASTGGIDLTSDKTLTVQNNGQSIQFHFDPAQLQELQGAIGFDPVVVGLHPLGNLKNFLESPN